MNHLKQWMCVLGAAVLLSSAGGVMMAEASIESQVADFGDVLEGETKSIPIQITNYDTTQPLQVLMFLEGGTAGFILESSMLILGPGETQTVIVSYTSTGEGEVSDKLVVTYMGGQTPEEVLLTANGVQEQEPVDIYTVAAFFEQAVGEGTLTGVGPGRSAEHRLNALGNMLLKAEALFDMGDHEQACEELQAAAKKLSVEEEGGAGKKGKGPAVFAEGESALELAGMIQEVREGLCGEGASELAYNEALD